MPAIAAGSITAFYLYDVADTIDLATARRLIGTAAPSPMAAKAPAPPSAQYVHPPIAIDGRALGLTPARGAEVRFKVFDYGVVSMALTQPMPSDWDALIAEGLEWHDDPQRAAESERFCRTLTERIAPPLHQPRAALLSEDYLVFALTQLDRPEPADALLAANGGRIAQLLRGEREPLSAQERDDVLRHRISYLATDVVVPTWNAAFIYDTEAGAQGILDILEFANSQLLQFRSYDQLLDEQLARIYAELQERAGWRNWFRRRYTRAARQVHALFIDVNELTDKTENALKIAGDVYAARLFTLVAARFGLEQWKSNVRDKLKTLDDIYRFAVEQTAMARGELLELTIVAILVFELMLFFAGLRSV